MIRTRVGYGGGKTPYPDYGNIGDHTETIQIDFDPQRITYAELLAVFWKSHRPGQRSWSTQYRNAVFFHNEAQRKLAMNSKSAVEDRTGRSVHTDVVPLNSFTWAEDYHQKYTLRRQSKIVGELKRVYPDIKDFVNSTAVARLNGYVGGHGSKEQLSRELDSLGLSIASRQELAEMVRGKGRYF